MKFIIKEYAKEITCGVVVGIVLASIQSVAGIINKAEISFRLSTILTICSILVLFVVLYWFEHCRSKRLKKELEAIKNPISERLHLFSIGDHVILTTAETKFMPKASIVTKIEGNRVYCRDEKNEITDYAPEELYTAVETKRILDRKEAERRYTEQQNANQWNDFFTS